MKGYGEIMKICTNYERENMQTRMKYTRPECHWYGIYVYGVNLKYVSQCIKEHTIWRTERSMRALESSNGEFTMCISDWYHCTERQTGGIYFLWGNREMSATRHVVPRNPWLSFIHISFYYFIGLRSFALSWVVTLFFPLSLSSYPLPSSFPSLHFAFPSSPSSALLSFTFLSYPVVLRALLTLI